MAQINHSDSNASPRKPVAETTAERPNSASTGFREAAETNSAGFREAAEKTSSSAKEAYGRMQVASDQATGVVQATYGILGDYVAANTRKALDIAKANADATFEHLRALIGARTLSEAIGLQTAYAQNVFGALSGQVKDFQDASQKAVADAGQTGRAAWDKGLNQPTRPQ